MALSIKDPEAVLGSSGRWSNRPARARPMPCGGRWPSGWSGSGKGAGKIPISRHAWTRSARECAALPGYDTRSPDEIIGYDECGLW